jgi:hypothetical protein
MTLLPAWTAFAAFCDDMLTFGRAASAQLTCCVVEQARVQTADVLRCRRRLGGAAAVYPQFIRIREPSCPKSLLPYGLISHFGLHYYDDDIAYGLVVFPCALIAAMQEYLSGSPMAP